MSYNWQALCATRDLPPSSWTELSIRRASSSRVGLCVDKKPNPWTTHPVADLALEDLHRSRLASNSWMRRTSNSFTADLHVECQPVLSIASVSSSEGVMLHWVIVVFRQSLYRLYQPGHSVVGASVISLQYTARSHLLPTDYNQGTLIPECNGLSQFRVDTAEPSVLMHAAH